nr:hypothetical protein [Lysinibacillus timonensis]
MPSKIYFGSNGDTGVLMDPEDIGKGALWGFSIFTVIGIAAAILSIILAIMIILGLAVYIFVYTIVQPVYNFILIKLLLLPSTFDLFFSILKDHHFIRIFIFIALIVIYLVGSLLIRNKIARYYLYTNVGIIVLRILFSLSVGIMGFFLAEGETLSDGQLVQTEYKLENIQSNYNPDYHYRTYSQRDEEQFPDANHENFYNDALWVTFGENSEEIGQQVFFSNDFRFDGFLFSTPKDINRFKTTISYAPTTEENTYTNRSSFTISIVADGKAIESFSLSPDNNVIHVDLPVKVEETFGIKIEGDIQDQSIVSLLDPQFIRQF